MQNIFPGERGFTLIEVVIVLALVAFVANDALLISFDAYRANSYRNERSTFIALLQHARAQSMHSVCLAAVCSQAPAHGVAIRSGRYVLFEGASYASRTVDLDSIIDESPLTVHAGISEVIFQPSSGHFFTPGDIILSAPDGHVSIITIGAEGQISWTN